MTKCLALFLCLFYLQVNAQTVEGVKPEKQRLKYFGTIQIVFNTVRALALDETKTKTYNQYKSPFSKQNTPLYTATVGAFFTKRSFAEVSLTVISPQHSYYTVSYSSKERQLNTSIIGAINYGLKLPLEDEGKAFFMIKGGVNIGGASITTDSKDQSMGGSSYGSHNHIVSNYAGGIALGANAGIGFSLKLKGIVSLNTGLSYTYFNYSPHTLAIVNNYHSVSTNAGIKNTYDGINQTNTTYGFLKAPPMPINLLAVNLGLGFNF